MRMVATASWMLGERGASLPDGGDELGQRRSVAAEFGAAFVAVVLPEGVLLLRVMAEPPQPIQHDVFALAGDLDPVVVAPPHPLTRQLQGAHRAAGELQGDRDRDTAVALVMEGGGLADLAAEMTHQVDVVDREVEQERVDRPS